MRFVKMHGIGNDYVYVNAFTEHVDDAPALARLVADRHTGIGSDGLILVAPPSSAPSADVRMQMFNADGSESEMCGNGIRCVAKFAIDRGLSKRNPLRVETGRGVLSIRWEVGADGKVTFATVDMGVPILECSRIPAIIPGVAPTARVVLHRFDDAVLSGAGVEPHVTCVSVGNPHAVFYCDDVAAVPLERIGPAIERHAWFPKRINAHIVEVVAPDEVIMRTWERGSGITRACGTGASAVCVAGVLAKRTRGEILAHLPGGDLRLRWDGEGASVFKTGPATEVFEGELTPEWLASARSAAVEATQ